MRVVRNAVLREDKKIQIAMIGVAVFMLLISICNLTFDFTTGTVALDLFNVWATAISIIPITWGVCTALLIKTKKDIFSKMPAYIICSLIVLALCLYIIASGEDNMVLNILGFAVAVLLSYPFVIAVLTIEGRMYNRVFATVFSAILLVVTLFSAIAVCVVMQCFMTIFLVPALIYVELILSVLCYNLERPEKKEDY